MTSHSPTDQHPLLSTLLSSLSFHERLGILSFADIFVHISLRDWDEHGYEDYEMKTDSEDERDIAAMFTPEDQDEDEGEDEGEGEGDSESSEGDDSEEGESEGEVEGVPHATCDGKEDSDGVILAVVGDEEEDSEEGKQQQRENESEVEEHVVKVENEQEEEEEEEDDDDDDDENENVPKQPIPWKTGDDHHMTLRIGVEAFGKRFLNETHDLHPEQFILPSFETDEDETDDEEEGEGESRSEYPFENRSFLRVSGPRDPAQIAETQRILIRLLYGRFKEDKYCRQHFLIVRSFSFDDFRDSHRRYGLASFCLGNWIPRTSRGASLLSLSFHYVSEVTVPPSWCSVAHRLAEEEEEEILDDEIEFTQPPLEYHDRPVFDSILCRFPIPRLALRSKRHKKKGRWVESGEFLKLFSFREFETELISLSEQYVDAEWFAHTKDRLEVLKLSQSSVKLLNVESLFDFPKLVELQLDVDFQSDQRLHECLTMVSHQEDSTSLSSDSCLGCRLRIARFSLDDHRGTVSWTTIPQHFEFLTNIRVLRLHMFWFEDFDAPLSYSVLSCLYERDHLAELYLEGSPWSQLTSPLPPNSSIRTVGFKWYSHTPEDMLASFAIVASCERLRKVVLSNSPGSDNHELPTVLLDRLRHIPGLKALHIEDSSYVWAKTFPGYHYEFLSKCSALQHIGVKYVDGSWKKLLLACPDQLQSLDVAVKEHDWEAFSEFLQTEWMPPRECFRYLRAEFSACKKVFAEHLLSVEYQAHFRDMMMKVFPTTNVISMTFRCWRPERQNGWAVVLSRSCIVG